MGSAARESTQTKRVAKLPLRSALLCRTTSVQRSLALALAHARRGRASCRRNQTVLLHVSAHSSSRSLPRGDTSGFPSQAKARRGRRSLQAGARENAHPTRPRKTPCSSCQKQDRGVHHDSSQPAPPRITGSAIHVPRVGRPSRWYFSCSKHPKTSTYNAPGAPCNLHTLNYLYNTMTHLRTIVRITSVLALVCKLVALHRTAENGHAHARAGPSRKMGNFVTFNHVPRALHHRARPESGTNSCSSATRRGKIAKNGRVRRCENFPSRPGVRP